MEHKERWRMQKSWNRRNNLATTEGDWHITPHNTTVIVNNYVQARVSTLLCIFHTKQQSSCVHLLKMQQSSGVHILKFYPMHISYFDIKKNRRCPHYHSLYMPLYICVSLCMCLSIYLSMCLADEREQEWRHRRLFLIIESRTHAFYELFTVTLI